MSSRSQKTVLVLGLLAIALLALANVQPSFLHDESGKALAQSQEPTSSEATIANCRYGASPLNGAHTPVLTDIGAGWYLNFQPFPPAGAEPANGAEFVHMISVEENNIFINPDPNKMCENPDYYQWLGTYNISPPLNQSFANYIKNNPGKTYIVGNEIDRVCQGQTHASVYAEAYNKTYNFIKSNDPTSQVAISGLVQFSPNRRQYLDDVWNAYIAKFGTTIPVDIWTMHVYVLPELMANSVSPNNIASIALGTNASSGKKESGGNATLCGNPNSDVYCIADHSNKVFFADHIVAMRKWMKEHGQQNKPLLLSEYSILFPADFPDENGVGFTPQRVITYQNETFSYLNSLQDPNLGYPMDGNRLVQQWMWFSIYSDGAGSSSNIVQSDLTTLTSVGQNFKNHVAGQPLYHNLLVDDVADVTITTEGAPSVTANISATFRNNGSEAINAPFTVTFYRNANLTDEIGSVTIDPTVYGCASHAYTATVPWPGLTEGSHTFYTELDSGHVIPESNDGDNVGQGTVSVYMNQTLFPIVRSAVN